MNIRRSLAILASATMFCGSAATAQQVTRIVVPFNAGGATDAYVRLIASELSKRGTQTIVENKPGASGIIGAEYVVKSKPDGTTLFTGSNSTLANNLVLFEGMADPMRMMQAAELCRRAGKPLVVHKIATSERGTQAAISHTGSVAGSQAAYRAAFERAGAVIVDEVEALIETTVFFAKAPLPKARGVAIAAVSGGACIMLADKAEAHKIDLPHPAPATMAVLERIVPEFGTVGNPCDVTAQVLSTPEHLHDCFDALLADPNYGTLVMPHMFAYAAGTSRVAVLDQAAARHGKIACSVWLTQHLEGPGALETKLSEHESKQVLTAYGISIVDERLVQSAEAAVEALLVKSRST